MKSSNLQVKLNIDTSWRLFLIFSSILIVFSSSDIAFSTANSGSDDVIGNTLCKLVGNLTGGIARGIATLAIFAAGVSLFIGKLNWITAAGIAAAVGIIFGAPNLVNFLSGQTGGCTENQGSTNNGGEATN